MTKIKKVLFVLLSVIVFSIRFHIYDSIMVKAEETKATIRIVDQKSEIEEPHTINIVIEEEEPINIIIKEEEPRTIEIFIEEKKEEKPKKIEQKVEKMEPVVQEPVIEEAPVIPETPIVSVNQYAGIINTLTPYDKELICRISYLEAGNQCIEGQRAVIEVILNRVVSPQWPNTVEGVLSAPRQFSTWKNKDKVSVEQIAQMNNVLNIVACSNDVILPDINYVYFNNKSNSKSNIKIHGHWFWK